MIEKPVFNLKRIRSRGPLREKVYQVLKEAIIRGELAHGTRLHEEQLTRALGISRTPLREAFNRLKSDGLIEVVPRKGAHIVELTDTDLVDLFEAREVLETTFLIRSARRLERAVFERIRAGLKKAEEEMTAAEDDPKLWDEKRAEYLRLDRAFHDELVVASGNKYWVKLYYDIRDRIEIYSHQISYVPDRFRIAIEDHYAILDALLAGDLIKAEGLMRTHIRKMRVSVAQMRQGRDDLRQQMASSPSRAELDRP